MSYSKLDIGRKSEISFPIMCFLNCPGSNNISDFFNVRRVSRTVKNAVDKVFSEVISTREDIKNRSISRTLNFFDRLLWRAATESTFLYKTLFRQSNCDDFSFCALKSEVFVNKERLGINFSNIRLSDISKARENREQMENIINAYNKNKSEGLTVLRQNIDYNFIWKIFGFAALLVFLYFFVLSSMRFI